MFDAKSVFLWGDRSEWAESLSWCLEAPALYNVLQSQQKNTTTLHAMLWPLLPKRLFSAALVRTCSPPPTPPAVGVRGAEGRS